VSGSNEPSNLDVHTVIGYSCNRFQFAACPEPRAPSTWQIFRRASTRNDLIFDRSGVSRSMPKLVLSKF